jgi:hypothetical protein
MTDLRYFSANASKKINASEIDMPTKCRLWCSPQAMLIKGQSEFFGAAGFIHEDRITRKTKGFTRTGRQFMTDEYLTIEELSARLKLKPKTVKNKMASGVFQKGVHYFSPLGLGPRFKWSAVVAWLEANDPQRKYAIPMRGGYELKI